MMANKKSKPLSTLDRNPKMHLDKDYLSFLTQVKKKLQHAQVKAALAANTEQIRFYWELGTDILKQQENKRWGSHFLEQLSKDMRNAFPGMQGFSKRNLEFMRRFALTYPSLDFAKQPVSQLPWGHIIRLIQAVSDDDERNWYASQAIENGWSRAILTMQIDSDLYKRQAKLERKTNNFNKHLPASQSELATEMLKDPYKFDFLTIQEKASERDIEAGLTHHIRDFLLELGEGFSFVGTQVPVTFDDTEYFIDMLFYHLKLRAFIVCELKATKFKPEHTGQLGFYLAVVDDQLRHADDNRTIGLLLCKEKNKVVAEYALQNINAPIGVSEYTLSKALPTDLKTALPSIEEIEAELNTPDDTDDDNGSN